MAKEEDFVEHYTKNMTGGTLKFEQDRRVGDDDLYCVPKLFQSKLLLLLLPLVWELWCQV